jgi:hypothetical protein
MLGHVLSLQKFIGGFDLRAAPLEIRIVHTQ